MNLSQVGLAAATLVVAADLMAGELSSELGLWQESAGPGDSVAIIATYRGAGDAMHLRTTLAGEDRARRRELVPLSLRAQAESDSAELVDSLFEAGVTDVELLWLINGLALSATPAVLDVLLNDDDVVQVRLDALLDSPLAMAGAEMPPEWNIAFVGAPALWDRGYFGGSVVVAILDTGVDVNHPELASSWRGGTNSWFDPYGEHSTPYDRMGHGTQALGLIVGGSASGSTIGVAPDAQWIAAKVFNDEGTAQESAVHEAFQWLLDPDGDPTTDDAPDVVSNSWGLTDAGVCNTVFQPDIEALKAADIAVVFSAGNSGPAPSSGVSPGNNPGVLSVGAIDGEGVVASFSSRGPSSCGGGQLPHVVAPGDGVFTTDLSFGGNEFYVQVSGTSFAAPQVAGVIALLRDAVPPASVAEIESALAGTAIDAATPGVDHDTGYGLINAGAALEVLAFPVDIDGDGYSAGIDCDDTDPSIFPGAPERHSDGVDQDCNGYDMTMTVRQAVYSHDGGSIYLRITSNFGEQAALEIAGGVPLQYREVRGDWFLNGGGVDGYENPTITVIGLEGELEITPRPPTPRRD